MQSQSSRRDLLKLTAVTATSLLLPLNSRAQTSPAAAPLSATAPSDRTRGLKIGAASYTFRKLPTDAAIKAMQRCDIHYCSIKDFHLALTSSLQERRDVARRFRDAGITPISCGVITMPKEEAGIRRAFEYARDCGMPTIVCKPDPGSFDAIDKLVAEYDIRIAIHNHGPEDTTYPTPAVAWNHIKDHDPRIGICIDVGHTTRAKADPAADVRQYQSRLFDMHIKDLAAAERGTDVPVGRGIIDIPAILKALLDIQYPHHVGFEYERDADDPIPGFAESVGYVKGVLAAMPA